MWNRLAISFRNILPYARWLDGKPELV
jgi:hypothetical protein